MDFLQNIKAIIFDFDGTLYDFRHLPFYLILNSPKNIIKIKNERKARRQLKGKYFGSAECFYNEQKKSLYRTGSFSSEEQAQLWFRDFYIPNMISTLQKHFTARPGTRELFELFRSKGIKTAVFSDYSGTDLRLKAIGLDPSIADLVTSAEELGGLKPAAEPFGLVAQKLGCQSQNILVVGDRNDTDGQGARNAGMNFLQIITHKTKNSDQPANHPVLSWNDFCSLSAKQLKTPLQN